MADHAPDLRPSRRAGDLAEGSALPTLERTIDLVSMVAYAGATWDWHRMHYDREYVDEKGFAAPVVDGQVFGAIMAEHLQDELGPLARIRSLSFRFRAMVFAGERIMSHATCTSIDGTTATFDLRIDATDAAGEQRVAVTGEATVEVAP